MSFTKLGAAAVAAVMACSAPAFAQWQTTKPVSKAETLMLEAMNDYPWVPLSNDAINALGGDVVEISGPDVQMPVLFLGSMWNNSGTLGAWSVNRWTELEESGGEYIPLPTSFTQISSAVPIPEITGDGIAIHTDEDDNPTETYVQIRGYEAAVEVFSVTDNPGWEGSVRGTLISIKTDIPSQGVYSAPFFMFYPIEELDADLAADSAALENALESIRWTVGSPPGVTPDEDMRHALEECQTLFQGCMQGVMEEWDRNIEPCHNGYFYGVPATLGALGGCKAGLGVGCKIGGFLGALGGGIGAPAGAIVGKIGGCIAGGLSGGMLAGAGGVVACKIPAWFTRNAGRRACAQDYMQCAIDAGWCIYFDLDGDCRG